MNAVRKRRIAAGTIGLGALVLLMTVTLTLTAVAQRGVGDPEGIVAQGRQPGVVTLSGTLTEIQSHPCKMTTGRYAMGTHLILSPEQGDDINLHLGPTVEVEDIVKQLEPGNRVEADAFRTEKLPENAYIAKSLRVEKNTISLRTDELRPVWAGQGRGQGWRGRQYTFGPVDPAQVLSVAKKLKLAPEQIEKLEAIEKEARNQARGVLTDEQLLALDELRDERSASPRGQRQGKGRGQRGPRLRGPQQRGAP